jgi:hypothetical protein
MTGRRIPLRWVPPVLLVVAAVVTATLWARRDGRDPQPETVAITAAGPHFDSAEALAAGSDVVVIATVTAVDAGRALTDPARPDAGIRTQLARLDVDRVVTGTVDGPLVVEQEATLLDGTPIAVNGLAPLVVGVSGVFFLVDGRSDEFPYRALVNEQGFVPVTNGRVAPVDDGDAIWKEWAGRPVDDLAAAAG